MNKVTWFRYLDKIDIIEAEISKYCEENKFLPIDEKNFSFIVENNLIPFDLSFVVEDYIDRYHESKDASFFTPPSLINMFKKLDVLRHNLQSEKDFHIKNRLRYSYYLLRKTSRNLNFLARKNYFIKLMQRSFDKGSPDFKSKKREYLKRLTVAQEMLEKYNDAELKYANIILGLNDNINSNEVIRIKNAHSILIQSKKMYHASMKELEDSESELYTFAL